MGKRNLELSNNEWHLLVMALSHYYVMKGTFEPITLHTGEEPASAIHLVGRLLALPDLELSTPQPSKPAADSPPARGDESLNTGTHRPADPALQDIPAKIFLEPAAAPVKPDVSELAITPFEIKPLPKRLAVRWKQGSKELAAFCWEKPLWDRVLLTLKKPSVFLVKRVETDSGIFLNIVGVK